MHYTTGIDEQDLSYFCSADCLNKHIEEIKMMGESVRVHVGKGDPELCDSLLCEKESV